jgi:hypothetical protein
MQLRTARLCLDCSEVHDAQRCPACASETFAYLTRWVPENERQTAPPRAESSPEAEVYRELLHPEQARANRRILSQGLLGLTALGVAGYFLKGSRPRVNGGPPEDAATDHPPSIVDQATPAGDGGVS